LLKDNPELSDELEQKIYAQLKADSTMLQDRGDDEETRPETY